MKASKTTIMEEAGTKSVIMYSHFRAAKLSNNILGSGIANQTWRKLNNITGWRNDKNMA